MPTSHDSSSLFPVIPVQLLHPDAKTPLRANRTDAGADLYALESGHLLPGQRGTIRTGLAVAIPIGYYGRIAPRSGLAVKSGVDTMAGVIDSSYRGEVKVCLINLSNGGPEEVFSWNKGDRIAQLIVEACALPDFAAVDSLDETARGAGGFGSSGTS